MFSWLTVFGKGGKFKNWMLEQPVNNTACSSIKKCYFIKFFGAKKFHFLKYKQIFWGWFLLFFRASFQKLAQGVAYITTGFLINIIVTNLFGKNFWLWNFLWLIFPGFWDFLFINFQKLFYQLAVLRLLPNCWKSEMPIL